MTVLKPVRQIASHRPHVLAQRPRLGALAHEAAGTSEVEGEAARAEVDDSNRGIEGARFLALHLEVGRADDRALLTAGAGIRPQLVAGAVLPVQIRQDQRMQLMIQTGDAFVGHEGRR